jgi:hypothetical protein
MKLLPGSKTENGVTVETQFSKIGSKIGDLQVFWRCFAKATSDASWSA